MISREEAIERLYLRRMTAAEILDSLPPKAREKSSMNGYIESLDMAIGDMQKQIPKKPYLWGDGYADGVLIYDMWDCPNCEKTYEVDYEEYKHCPNCGQAIDWSEHHEG